jgi:hypothetical protein
MHKTVRFIAVSSLALTCTVARALPPERPTHIFQGLYVGKNSDLIAVHSDGIFKSVDDGEHWKAVLPLPQFRSRSMQIVDAGEHGLLVSEYPVRTYRSTDNGEHWQEVGNGHAISAVGSDGTLYGCNSAVEVSEDLGASWSMTKTQPALMYPTGANSCDTIASAGTMLYVSDKEGGLHASGDRGASWRKIKPLPAEYGHRSGFVADNRGNLLVNTFVNLDGTRYENRVYLSPDQGRSWKRLEFGVPSQQRLSVEIEAMTPSALYMRCSLKDRPDNDQLCISEGALTSLQATSLDNALSVIGAVLYAGPNGRLYALTMYGINSADGSGKNWRRLGLKGIPDPYTGKPQ